jgi:hypothetical protein
MMDAAIPVVYLARGDPDHLDSFTPPLCSRRYLTCTQYSPSPFFDCQQLELQDTSTAVKPIIHQYKAYSQSSSAVFKQ